MSRRGLHPDSRGARPTARLPAPRDLPRVLFLAVAVVALAGCTVEPPSAREPARVGPKLVPVGGRVTVDGQPLAGAVVAFLPVFSGAGTHSVGETGADGTYTLSHMDMPGTAPGEYKVAVSYMVGPHGKVASLEARSAELVPPEVNEGRELVPKHYSDFSQTELRATVRPGGSSIDFDLDGPLLPAPGTVKTALPSGGSKADEAEHPPAPGAHPDGPPDAPDEKSP